MTSSYLHKKFREKMNRDRMNIKTIVECGSRDCLDSISLQEYYTPDVVYAFECNPESIPICKNNIKGRKKIKLVKKAVCDKDELIAFYPTDMEKSIDKNIGASSLLLHRDNTESFIQKTILVEGIRLDTWMEKEGIAGIDLLCMDLQGAEHLAIKGLGRRIKDVSYIITEISFQSYYKGDMSAWRVVNILKRKGFKLMGSDADSGFQKREGFGNALFKNNRDRIYA